MQVALAFLGVLRGGVCLSRSPACGPSCRDSSLCLSGAWQCGCRALLAFPLSYPFPVAGDTLSHESRYIPPSYLPLASCNVLLSPFREGTDSPGIWSGSRLANARSAFSRQACLGRGELPGIARVFSRRPPPLWVFRAHLLPWQAFLSRRKLRSWGGGRNCVPARAPLGCSSQWPSCVAGCCRGTQGRQAGAAEGLAGCNKQSASCSSSIFFFSVQWKRAILTLRLLLLLLSWRSILM